MTHLEFVPLLMLYVVVRETCVSFFETPSRTIPLKAEGVLPVIRYFYPKDDNLAKSRNR